MTGSVRWPPETDGTLVADGFMICHFGSSEEPVNWSDCGEQPAVQVTGASCEEPAWTRTKSNDAVPPPFVPRKATGPTFSAPVSGAAWVEVPTRVQLAPSSVENSPMIEVPSLRARSST